MLRDEKGEKGREATEKWRRIALKILVKRRNIILSLAKESSPKPGEYGMKTGGRKHSLKNVNGRFPAKTGGLESLLFVFHEKTDRQRACYLVIAFTDDTYQLLIISINGTVINLINRAYKFHI